MKIKLKYLFIAFLLLQSCSSLTRFSASAQKDDSPTQETVFYGVASYYSDEFEGRKTANGEIYSKNKLSAAHKTLAFGTILKVRNLQNNLTTIVVVNDRGPFVQGRVIDLSRAAAEQIGMIEQGIVEVEITIIK